ncbi:MAG: hypothetical protein ABEJ99_02130 [Candidatus Nanohaloarchaea archaeon]
MNLSNSITYSTDDELVFRRLSDGRTVRRTSIREKVRSLKKYPGKDYLVGFQGSNLSFFTLEGKKVYSQRYPEMYRGIQFTQYDEDPEKELAYASKRAVHVIDVDFEEVELNRSVGSYVFTGSGEEVFKAVAENASVLPDTDRDRAYRETGKTVVGIGSEGNISLSSLSSQYNLSGKRYYADSREKKVYVAAIAARENASLVDRDGEATFDFSNYSVKELQDLFIKRYHPNHVVVADLGSENGLLASYMAARKGYLPIDSVGWDGSEENRHNAVIKLKKRLVRTFDRIGDNRRTVFQGKYISLLDAPRIRHEDPVENGWLMSDPEDGDHYYSDLGYGNLDDDQFLEASVGRYPGKTGLASILFMRSVSRNDSKNAVVASEYMSSNWPTVLATFGGGMRYGKAVRDTLETEGYNTTQLVEYRANPVAFLVGLTPSELGKFMQETDVAKRAISKEIGAGAGLAVKNAMIAVRALHYAEQITEIYYEYRWSSYHFDLGRGLKRVKKMSAPVDTSKKGVFSKSVIRGVFAFFWPDRKPQLTRDNLRQRMQSSDIIYYQGVGNSTAWTLPNRDGSILKDRYNGQNSFRSRDIPDLGSPIVWDNSLNAGKKDSVLKNRFLEKGASAFLGFSSQAYGAFTEPIATSFFLHGKTVGQALATGENYYRAGGLIYSPKTALKTGVREKMSHSLTLYGNPEMEKDPLARGGKNITKSCESRSCTLHISIDPEIRTERYSGTEIPVFDADSYLASAGTPITPLYIAKYRLPDGADIKDRSVDTHYRKVNYSLPETSILSSSGNFTNLSQRPSSISSWNMSSQGELVFVAAGAKNESGSTKVLDYLSANITYSSPVNVQLEDIDGELIAHIRSQQSFKGKLIYSVNGSKSVRPIQVDSGENTFRLEKPSYGRSLAEVYIVNKSVVAYARNILRRFRPVNTYLFAPDISVGETRSVKLVAKNPNSFPVRKSYTLETGNLTQPGFLETRSREVLIPGKEDETITWMITGLREGEAHIDVADSRINLHVTNSHSLKSSLGVDRFISSIKSRDNEFSFERRPGSFRASVETSRGKIRYIKEPDLSNTSISTRNLRVYITRYRTGLVKVVKTADGVYMKSVQNRITSTRNQGVSASEAEKYFEMLARERNKLIQRYQARALSLKS